MPTITPRTLSALLGALPGQRPAYVELTEAIRLLVVDGRIPPGGRLPGSGN
ncbi:hypothetical protein [Branchiibius cervicis]|uniref:GntR family transcriptional regulator n=1 Tax=Branchiibius cervicis TaxID=908252 RepID=A0ABW2AXN5_9MICO